ncbi:MAG: hypothetical protein ACE5GW_08375 [Planctomycetota bacterium]
MRAFLICSGVVAICGLPIPGLQAQNPSYMLELSHTIASPGSQADVDVMLSNAGMGEDLAGFNIDVCHDAGVLDPVALTAGPPSGARATAPAPDGACP